MHFEMYQATQQLLYSWNLDLPIATENSTFTPPADGSMWLKYDYSEADARAVSLDRHCRVYIGMVQLSIFFAPGDGIAIARKLAQYVAKRAADGIMLRVKHSDGSTTFAGWINEGGAVSPVQKTPTGWFFPVRFYTRAEVRE